MDAGVSAVNDQIKEASGFAYRLREEIGSVIVGQRYLIDRLLIGLLANGHVLLEGVPGLAKTLSVKTLAQTMWKSLSADCYDGDGVHASVFDGSHGTYRFLFGIQAS